MLNFITYYGVPFIWAVAISIGIPSAIYWLVSRKPKKYIGHKGSYAIPTSHFYIR
jgi:hypothetical protein